MTDFAEHTIAMRRLLRDAEQCERDKLYSALVVELDEIGRHWRDAYEWALMKQSEQLQERAAA